MFGNTNDNSTFPFQINGEVINLKEKVFESGKRLSEIMVPVMAQLHFENFEESIKKGEYEKVYKSGVYKVIADLCDGTNFIKVKPDTKVLRARAIKEINDLYRSEKGIHIENDVLRGYDWYNSKEPPIGISPEGRANAQYSSYFYCATDGPTAASEIKANIGDYISLASFTIKRELKLVRLETHDVFDGKTLEDCYKNLIANRFSVPVKDSREYRLTQFISDEIRKHGVDGICYRSHFTNDDNYVVFNCSMDTIQFVNSKIIRLHSQKLNFVDFSSDKMIRTEEIPDLSKTEIQTEKSHIIGIMRSYPIGNDIKEE